MKQNLTKIVFTALLVLWVILITILSLAPTNQMSHPLLNIEHLDKVAHFMFYFVFALLLFRLMYCYKFTSLTVNLLVAAIVPIVYSGGIEMFQEYLTTTREADFLDFLMNIMGAVFAVLFGKKLFKLEFQKQYVKEFS